MVDHAKRLRYSLVDTHTPNVDMRATLGWDRDCFVPEPPLSLDDFGTHPKPNFENGFTLYFCHNQPKNNPIALGIKKKTLINETSNEPPAILGSSLLDKSPVSHEEENNASRRTLDVQSGSSFPHTSHSDRVKTNASPSPSSENDA